MIPDATIEKYLGSLFGVSEPGQNFHHLLLARGAERGAIGALGLPDPDKLEVRWYAIAPTDEVDAELFVNQTIAVAAMEAQANEAVIYFAGLAMEVYAVDDDGTEVTENLARRLKNDRKLQEHPGAVEVTRLYAACRDGRRWTGEHYLTGPQAGAISGPTVRTGRLTAEESGFDRRLIRHAVGLPR